MRGTLPSDVIDAIVEGRCADPFAVLGLHESDGTFVVRAFVPGAESVDAVTRVGDLLAHLVRLHPGGYFEGAVERRTSYRLRAANPDGRWTVDDPYAYGPVLGPIDDGLIGEGSHVKLYDRLGAHAIEHEGAAGVHFALWAPNAKRVSVVGDFNAWDGRRHVMRKRIDTGVWEIFIPTLEQGTLYKYEIIGADGTLLPLKADPVGLGAELRPSTASIAHDTAGFVWTDGEWMAARADPTRDASRCPFMKCIWARAGYRLGLPLPGRWREILNSDAVSYGGSGWGNAGGVDAKPEALHGYACSAEVTIPPLGALWLVHEGNP